VGSASVVEAGELPYYRFEVALVERDQVVEAFSADGSD